MDPISLAVMGGSKLLQNLNEREQQSRMGLANAEMMRYSPWTGLAEQASKGFQSNMAFNPGADLAQGAANVFGTAKAQEAADKKAAADRETQLMIAQIMAESQGSKGSKGSEAPTPPPSSINGSPESNMVASVPSLSNTIFARDMYAPSPTPGINWNRPNMGGVPWGQMYSSNRRY